MNKAVAGLVHLRPDILWRHPPPLKNERNLMKPPEVFVVMSILLK